jgi:hypothetical protein
VRRPRIVSSRRGSIVFLGAMAVLLAVGLALIASGGSDQATPKGSSTLPFDSPSRTELEKATGLRLPASVTGYQSVQLAPNQLDVTFHVPPADVGALVEASRLPPLSSTRVIAHPSPLWDLNPSGTVHGTTTTRDGMRINLEVVDGTPSVVRLDIVAAGASTTTTTVP